MQNLLIRLRAAWVAFRYAQINPNFAVVYDYGPESEPIEEYYEAFSTPDEALEMFRTAFPKDEMLGDFYETTRNERLVVILGDIDDYR